MNAERSGLAHRMAQHFKCWPQNSHGLSESLKGREGLPELDSDVAHQGSAERKVASRVEDSGLHHGVCQTLGFCPLRNSNHNPTPNTTRQNHVIVTGSAHPQEKLTLASSRGSQLGSLAPGVTP